MKMMYDSRKKRLTRGGIFRELQTSLIRASVSGLATTAGEFVRNANRPSRLLYQFNSSGTTVSVGILNRYHSPPLSSCPSAIFQCDGLQNRELSDLYTCSGECSSHDPSEYCNISVDTIKVMRHRYSRELRCAVNS